MGPIFSEYLYVKFFQQSPGQQTNDDRFWSSDKFQELLMQLRYHIAPDQSLITDGEPRVSSYSFATVAYLKIWKRGARGDISGVYFQVYKI